MKFKNKVCVITGGAGGLCKATALRLLDFGLKVILLDLYEPKYDVNSYTNLYFEKVDITEKVKVKNVFDTIYKKHGNIHILINCAGIGHIEPTIKDNETHSYENFMRIIIFFLLDLLKLILLLLMNQVLFLGIFYFLFSCT